MTLNDLLHNLENTIAGKEELYAVYNESDDVRVKAVAKFLEINLTELRTIRNDVIDIIKDTK